MRGLGSGEKRLPLFNEVAENAFVGILQAAINLGLATVFGFAIALIYRRTHSGISYSQGFVVSLLLVTIISSAAMMVIGTNIARAFGLVGALSIIRYRTVVKDVKDAAYIFLALVTGFACGVGAFHIAVLTDAVVLGLIVILTRYHFGIMHYHDFVLSFVFDGSGDTAGYREVLDRLCSKQTLIHAEPGDQENSFFLSFDVSLREGVDATNLINTLQMTQGVRSTKIISAATDGTV